MTSWTVNLIANTIADDIIREADAARNAATSELQRSLVSIGRTALLRELWEVDSVEGLSKFVLTYFGKTMNEWMLPTRRQV